MRTRAIAVVVGLTLAISGVAVAEPATNSAPAAYDGISFNDSASLYGDASQTRIDINLTAAHPARFPARALVDGANRPRGDEDGYRYEMAVSASGLGGLPVDVAIAQRASFAVNEQGDLTQRGRGAELRLGQRLGLQQWRGANGARPAVYAFIASDNEALIWRPGGQNSFGHANGGFALQDRVEIGDRQAGVTWEHAGLQASLAYVERKVDATAGMRTISREERFTGITITMRR